MNADETVYGRYGGRDADSPDSRLSLRGLHYAMVRALEAHRHRPGPPRREQAGPASTVDQYPAARRRPAGSCIHCHQVYDFRRQALQAEGRWRRDDVWVCPPPENVGMTLEIDQGDRIRSVVPNSAAHRAGLAAGDRLVSLNAIAVASFADAQYALQRAPAQGTIPVTWERRGQSWQGRLSLAMGWRETDVSWRWSLRGLEPSPWVQGEDLSPAQKRRLGLAENQLAFSQGPFVSTPARQAGIQSGDVIIGIDGQYPKMSARQFLAFVRLHYQVGDRVTYHLLRAGQRLDVSLELARQSPL
jgi:hypothetical protein